MIPPEKIEEIISRTDLAALIGQYVTLKPAGKSLKANCPFHTEKTPSFVVTPEKGIFKCFGCGAGGGPIQFLMKIENIDFIDAVKILARNAGMELETSPQEKRALTEKDMLRKTLNLAVLFYHEVLTKSSQGKEALAYLHRRGLGDGVISDFRLGYAPSSGNHLVRHLRGRKVEYSQAEKAGLARRGSGDYYDYFRGRVVFPIFDSQGRPIGLGGRGIDDSVIPKYLNTPETPIFSKGTVLFGLDLAKAAIRRQEEVFVVEGYMDAVSLYGGGFTNVVASMGTSLTEEQARTIARYTGRAILAYDADSAGAAATMRGIEIFENAGLQVKVMSMPEGEDPDSIIRKKGPAAFKELAGKARGIIEFKIAELKSRINVATPEGKEQFVKELSPILKEVRGDIRRSEYIRVISEECRLPEELLRRSVAGRRVRKRAVDISPMMKKARLLPEEKLIAYLFSSPSFISLCRDYAHFSERHMHPDVLEIFRGLLSLDTTGMDVIGADHIYRIAKSENAAKKAVDLSMVEGLPGAGEEEIRAILREIDIREKKDRIRDIQDAVNRKFAQGQLLEDDPDYQEMLKLLREVKVPGK